MNGKMKSLGMVLGVAAVSMALVAPANAATPGQQNALRKAQSYLSFQSFSRKGLVEQLKYEGFTTSQAQYGAAKVHANWSAQAAKKAKEYLKLEGFSRKGLLDQLKYEGFTLGQATYGVNRAGL